MTEEIINELIDGDFVISDTEIKRLAKLGETHDGEIHEFKGKDGYTLILTYEDKGETSEEVLVCMKDKDKYLENSKKVLQEFVKYHVVDLGAIFGNKVYNL